MLLLWQVHQPTCDVGASAEAAEPQRVLYIGLELPCQSLAADVAVWGLWNGLHAPVARWRVGHKR